MVKVGGDWAASNLVAGAINTASGNKIFGDGNDASIGSGNTEITSKIASIVINGQVFGTPRRRHLRLRRRTDRRLQIQRRRRRARARRTHRQICRLRSRGHSAFRRLEPLRHGRRRLRRPRLRSLNSRVRRPRLGPTALFRLCRKSGLQRAVCDFLAFTVDYLRKPENSIRPPKRLAGASLGGGSAPEIIKLAADVIGWTCWSEAYVPSVVPALVPARLTPAADGFGWVAGREIDEFPLPAATDTQLEGVPVEVKTSHRVFPLLSVQGGSRNLEHSDRRTRLAP